ncbi:hypothetical protein [Citrobacter portucalensis]|uniref:hypothetical protein n=1 Tax=Citrobacter portucalensis TaxID=1639133 RepID=UPI00226B976F|nr:hypothetical protein [Citrobacter portucalensis]MCX8985952.1 hypothetical protein [Citrobacter portucalensis]
MKNRKFLFLLQEFAKLIQCHCNDIEAEQSMLCRYEDIDCYLEDGSHIRLNNQLIIIIPMSNVISAKTQVILNSNFSLSRDGYFAEVKGKGCCYLRHVPLPEQPQRLLSIISETVTIIRRIQKEIHLYVVD